MRVPSRFRRIGRAFECEAVKISLEIQFSELYRLGVLIVLRSLAVTRENRDFEKTPNCWAQLR